MRVGRKISSVAFQKTLPPSSSTLKWSRVSLSIASSEHRRRQSSSNIRSQSSSLRCRLSHSGDVIHVIQAPPPGCHQGQLGANLCLCPRPLSVTADCCSHTQTCQATRPTAASWCWLASDCTTTANELSGRSLAISLAPLWLLTPDPVHHPHCIEFPVKT